MAGAITEFAEDYSPMALVRRRLPWDDLNGDDIAQGELGCTYPTAGVCEFDTSLLPANFGEAVLSRPDPEIPTDVEPVDHCRRRPRAATGRVGERVVCAADFLRPDGEHQSAPEPRRLHAGDDRQSAQRLADHGLEPELAVAAGARGQLRHERHHGAAGRPSVRRASTGLRSIRGSISRSTAGSLRARRCSGAGRSSGRRAWIATRSTTRTRSASATAAAAWTPRAESRSTCPSGTCSRCRAPSRYRMASVSPCRFSRIPGA